MNVRNIWMGLTALMLIWLSCQRPENPIERGPLEFSADTVKFDSIFVNFLTPSERLIVRNPGNDAVRISQIWLEEGEETEFGLIADGIQADTVQDLVLGAGDSLHIFINLKSELRDEFTEEFLAIQIGDEVYRIPLIAKVIDAYYFRARLEQDGEGNFLSLREDSYFFGRSGGTDTTLTPDKPIIFDGPIFIPDGYTVNIMPGTQIFFTPYKFGISDSNGVKVFAFYSLWLVDGTVNAVGMPGDPIVFQGTRFDSLYQENPAQWRGLNFRTSSRDNVLEHVVVKNAMIGVQVDSLSLNQNPKLTVRHSSIRNMGAHGVVGVGFAPNTSDFLPPAILMENSEVNTCQERTLLLWGGGKYEFNNVTFANYNLSNFSRRQPQTLLINWFSFDGITPTVFPAFVDFRNCIMFGSEDNEILMDTLPGAPFDRLIWDHCLVRIEEEEVLPTLTSHLRNSIVNQDPFFVEPGLRNYRLQQNSPAIDAGLDLSIRYDLDIRGIQDSARSLPFDIGAYEYIPE